METLRQARNGETCDRIDALDRRLDDERRLRMAYEAVRPLTSVVHVCVRLFWLPQKFQTEKKKAQDLGKKLETTEGERDDATTQVTKLTA